MNSQIHQRYQLARERKARALTYVRIRKKRFIALLFTVAHVAGALTSVEAISQPRSSQGAVAWAVSLNTIPYIAVPLYWIIGNEAFNGYETKRHATRSETSPLVNLTIDQIHSGGFALKDERIHRLQERISNLPATTGNAVELLHVGEAIFDSITRTSAADSASQEPAEGRFELSASQGEILRLMSEGLSNAAIAARRETTLRSTESLVARTFATLGLSNDPNVNARVLAVRMWLQGEVVIRERG